MQQRFVSRLLETFFRRWWLYLIPLVLLAGLGAASVSQQPDEYSASGVITVSSQTLLSDLTSVSRGNSFGYETPASFTSRQINNLLGTELFMSSIVTTAGLSSAVESGAVLLGDLRSSLSAGPDGDALLKITATTENAELSYRLVDATIESYQQWEIDSTLGDSRSALDFLQGQLTPQQEQLDAARAELETYVSDHPGPSDATLRPLDEQIELNRLTAAVDQAMQRVTTTQQSLDEANLAMAQASTDVEQRLRVVDEPRVPSAPLPKLRDAVVGFALFLILGVLVSAVALTIGTLMDRSLRLVDDIEERLGVKVLTSLPDVPSRSVAARSA